MAAPCPGRKMRLFLISSVMPKRLESHGKAVEEVFHLQLRKCRRPCWGQSPRSWPNSSAASAPPLFPHLASVNERTGIKRTRSTTLRTHTIFFEKLDGILCLEVALQRVVINRNGTAIRTGEPDFVSGVLQDVAALEPSLAVLSSLIFTRGRSAYSRAGVLLHLEDVVRRGDLLAPAAAHLLACRSCD